MSELIYLAAPYSGDKETINARMELFGKCAARLINKGHFVVSPLYNHFILHHEDLPGDWDYWQHYSRATLAQCKAIIVLMIDGYSDSKGVQGEIEFATERGIRVYYLSVEEILNEDSNIDIN